LFSFGVVEFVAKEAVEQFDDRLVTEAAVADPAPRRPFVVPAAVDWVAGTDTASQDGCGDFERDLVRQDERVVVVVGLVLQPVRPVVRR
jgi:hypothetical protein